MPDAADTGRVLDELLAYARRGGMPIALERLAAELLVDLELELAEWRRGDQRRVRANTLALEMRRLRRAGTEVWQLADRFGKSRATVYRLLRRVA